MTPPQTDGQNAPDDKPAPLKLRLVYALRLSLPFVFVTALYLLLRFLALGGKLGANTQHLSLRTLLFYTPATLWFYVKVLLWPARLRAFADSTQTNAFSMRSVLLPALGVACIVAVLAWISCWTGTKAVRELPSAIQLDESGRCDEALPVFEEVTRQYPDDWFAWAGMGDCLVQLNDLPTAEQSLHRAADLSKNPRVIEQWQQVQARVSGSLPSPSK